MKASPTIIESYRHVQAEKNLSEEIVGGRAPESLPTDLGLRQGEQLGDYLAQTNCQFDAAYSSPAWRAIQTGLIAFKRASIDLPLTLEPGLHELSRGVWEGKNRDQALVLADGRTEYYPAKGEHNWHARVSRGESYADVAARKIEALTAIAHAHPPGNRIAVFGHAIATRCVAAALHGDDTSFFGIGIPHCSRTVFTYSERHGLQIQLFTDEQGQLALSEKTIDLKKHEHKRDF